MRTLGIAVLVCLQAQFSPAADDSYIAGYAAAVLEHEFSVTDATIQVENGMVTVTTKTIGKVDRGKVLSALKKIPGVKNAEIQLQDNAGAPAPSIPAEGEEPSAEGEQTVIPGPQPKWLPRGLLFSPLHADPRWPHFSAIYRNFTSGFGLEKGFSGNFGETFSIYRNKAPFGGEWDFGVQGGSSAFSMWARSRSISSMRTTWWASW